MDKEEMRGVIRKRQRGGAGRQRHLQDDAGAHGADDGHHARHLRGRGRHILRHVGLLDIADAAGRRGHGGKLGARGRRCRADGRRAARLAVVRRVRQPHGAVVQRAAGRAGPKPDDRGQRGRQDHVRRRQRRHIVPLVRRDGRRRGHGRHLPRLRGRIPEQPAVRRAERHVRVCGARGRHILLHLHRSGPPAPGHGGHDHSRRRGRVRRGGGRGGRGRGRDGCRGGRGACRRPGLCRARGRDIDPRGIVRSGVRGDRRVLHSGRRVRRAGHDRGVVQRRHGGPHGDELARVAHVV